MITRDEFMRRMKEMQASGGNNMFMMGDFPEKFNLIINSNHPINIALLEKMTLKTTTYKAIIRSSNAITKHAKRRGSNKFC